MKIKSLVVALLLSTTLLAQSKTDWINANVFYAIQVRSFFEERDYYSPVDFKKFIAQNVKKFEVIKGAAPLDRFGNYEKGLKGMRYFYSRDIYELNEKGNPVKYTNFTYSNPGSSNKDLTLMTELTLNYNENGLISGGKIFTQDTTGKPVNESEIIVKIQDGVIKTVSAKNIGKPSGLSLDFTIELKYRADGSLEKMVQPDDHPYYFKFDNQNRLVQMFVTPTTYIITYNKAGQIDKVSEEGGFDENFAFTYKYDKNGNLISKIYKAEYELSETVYSYGKDGLPVSAYEYYGSDDVPVQITNWEFIYTK